MCPAVLMGQIAMVAVAAILVEMIVVEISAGHTVAGIMAVLINCFRLANLRVDRPDALDGAI